ncbi:MAG: YegS/Rv2252/BmrU family lipid kinase [Myxococcales bacterium]|nr:YegS/Rv2252/BmrU family lipid kinase [Myxococcales bacterium]MCB9708180.1 YegS/Rv2252/BmrU family lipid kinase [Myxococcales bacterium]
MKTIVIANEAAGGGRCKRHVSRTLDALRDGGLVFDVARTRAPGDATHLARRAYDNGARRFVVLGGDGTTFEVVNGLFPKPHKEDPIELGLVPLGTGNSFLRDFGIVSRQQALAALLSGSRTPCDVARLEHREGVLFFINLLSLGFSATVGALRNARYAHWGTLGYALAVKKGLGALNIKRARLRVDEQQTWEEIEFVMLSFSNSQFTGGRMRMAPHADPTDGMLDMIHAGRLSRYQLLRAFPSIYIGTHVTRPQVQETRVRKAWFSAIDPQAAMIDGEIKTITPQFLEVLPAALQLRVA